MMEKNIHKQLDQGPKLLLDKETLVAFELPRLKPKSAWTEPETVTGG